MAKNGLDFYTAQETWMDETENFEINGYYIFTHGLDVQTSNCGQVGVAIILSPNLYNEYKLAGSPIPIIPPKHDTVSYGRFIGLRFTIRTDNNSRGAFSAKRKRKKFKEQKILVSLAYSPVEAPEQLIFNEFLSSIYTDIGTNTFFFQGQDVNASLGTLNSDENLANVLGRYGIEKRDDRGKETLDLLRTHNLCVATSYFQQPSYCTWTVFFHPQKIAPI